MFDGEDVIRIIWTVARHDLRLLLQERGIILNLVVIPVVLAFAVGFATQARAFRDTDGDPILIDIRDRDESDLSRRLLADLQAQSDQFVLCPLDTTANDICQHDDADLNDEDIAARLVEGISAAYIEIPAGFGESVGAGESTTLIYRSPDDPTTPSFTQQALQTVTQRLSGASIAREVGTDIAETFDAVEDSERADIADDIFERAAALWAADPITVQTITANDESPTLTPANGGFNQSIPGIASMYVLFAVLPLMGTVMRERATGTLPRLFTLPVSRAQILGGKLLARFIYGLLQYAIIFAFGYVIGVRYGSDPIALVLVMVAYTLCVTALALALMTVLRTEGQAAGVTLFLSLTLAPLGGAWWPLEVVPGWLATLGHISPVAWAMDAFNTLIYFGGNLGTVALPVSVLLALTIAFFVFGIMRFEYE